LEAAWTKNRRSGFQQLPAALVERLEAFVRSGEAVRLYDRFYVHRGDRNRLPANPLLYVPSHTARDLGIDLEAAGIPKNAPGGKIDFHACRNAYVSLVVESGATVKETQELARHSTPQLTMNVYARARTERLSEAVERVGEVVLSTPKRVPSVYRLAVGAEQETVTPSDTTGCGSVRMVEAASTTLSERTSFSADALPLLEPLRAIGRHSRLARLSPRNAVPRCTTVQGNLPAPSVGRKTTP
jgi:hypothetical protein